MLISVVIITYNHASFIKECIDSVLMQNVDSPMEIILADDCSTDGTREICEDYARKYPDIIRIVSSDHNVGAVENEQRAFIAAKGKYIATCEGDDYWTEPEKLSKQVHFLEANPDYSVCFHRFTKIHSENGILESDECDNVFCDIVEDSIEVSMHLFMHQWITQYLSMVFRRDCYDFEAYRRYKYYRDTHQIYHLLQKGKCRLFKFNGGVYRMTGGGEYTTMDAFHRAQMTLAVDEELWKVNNDKGWKEMCAVVMQDMIDNFYHTHNSKIDLTKYSFQILIYNKRFLRFIKNIKKTLL